MPHAEIAIASAPAHCTGCGAHTNVYCCSFVIVSMISLGPWIYPSRHPVIPWLLLNPSITSVRSLNFAGVN